MSKSIVKSSKPTALRFHFLYFAIANLFVKLVVFISHRRSCSSPGVTNLYVTESYFLSTNYAKGYYSLIHISEIKI